MDQFTDALRTADHEMYRAKATARDSGPRRLVRPTGHHVARPARAYGR
jgi:hypothetical protein